MESESFNSILKQADKPPALTKKGHRIVYFHADFLAMLCMQGNEIHARCRVGLPKDAKPVRVFPKPPTGLVGEEWIIAVIYESAEWEPLPKGSVIPDFWPPVAFEEIECSRTKEIRAELRASIGHKSPLNRNPVT